MGGYGRNNRWDEGLDPISITQLMNAQDDPRRIQPVNQWQMSTDSLLHPGYNAPVQWSNSPDLMHQLLNQPTYQGEIEEAQKPKKASRYSPQSQSQPVQQQPQRPRYQMMEGQYDESLPTSFSPQGAQNAFLDQIGPVGQQDLARKGVQYYDFNTGQHMGGSQPSPYATLDALNKQKQHDIDELNRRQAQDRNLAALMQNGNYSEDEMVRRKMHLSHTGDMDKLQRQYSDPAYQQSQAAKQYHIAHQQVMEALDEQGARSDMEWKASRAISAFAAANNAPQVEKYKMQEAEAQARAAAFTAQAKDFLQQAARADLTYDRVRSEDLHARSGAVLDKEEAHGREVTNRTEHAIFDRIPAEYHDQVQAALARATTPEMRQAVLEGIRDRVGLSKPEKSGKKTKGGSRYGR